jgi:predicted rRNA methylase YqxC with S4 and FtsJ domains
LSQNGEAFVLVKPQFECENKHIGKSGIVHTSAHVEIVKKVLGYARENALFPCDIVPAPIRKGKNVEYVLWLKKGVANTKNEREILEKVKYFVKESSVAKQ